MLPHFFWCLVFGFGVWFWCRGLVPWFGAVSQVTRAQEIDEIDFCFGI
jgi:hypothetical protein